MAIRGYHLKPLPPGIRIYAENLSIAGLGRRKSAAARFVRGREQRLQLEREPTNVYDKNAIRVFGYSKGLLRERRDLLGYVPKDVARVVVKGSYWPNIQARLLKTYLGNRGFVEIAFQLVGPDARAQEFKVAFATDDHYTGAVEKVKYLKSEGRLEEAIDLLLRLLDEVESEAAEAGPGWGAAPWYYEQLAIIYRKLRRIDEEVRVLERYMAQPHAPGAGARRLAERLSKARTLVGR